MQFIRSQRSAAQQLPATLTGPVVTDALGIPRYAATIWIDFLHGDLAPETRSSYCRAAKALYDQAERCVPAVGHDEQTVHIRVHLLKQRGQARARTVVRSVQAGWTPIFLELLGEPLGAEEKFFGRTPGEIGSLIKNLADELTGTAYSASDFRHTAAQRLVDGGASREEVSLQARVSLPPLDPTDVVSVQARPIRQFLLAQPCRSAQAAHCSSKTQESVLSSTWTLGMVAPSFRVFCTRCVDHSERPTSANFGHWPAFRNATFSFCSRFLRIAGPALLLRAALAPQAGAAKPPLLGADV